MTEQRNRLRVIRAEKRITQFGLARAARAHVRKLSQTKLSLIENGHLEPTSDERAAIALVLGVEETDVFPETVA